MRSKLIDIIMNVLNVAEKNDVAKNLANLMSRGTAVRREGACKYNKIYEFKYTIPMLGECNMIMTSVSGHLLNIDFVGNYRSWYGCDPVTLFNAPVSQTCVETTMQQIKKTLEMQARRCRHLIIWTDCDREGENIGFEVINVCRQVNPSMNVLRARFSEITGRAVERAVHNLVQPDKRVSDAVEVRKELDLRIGASFTRFMTMELKKKLPQLGEGVISYGSCQFPTLGFVVERYKQRVNFVPEDFWSIEVKYTKKQKPATFTWKRQRLFDEQVCIGFLAKIMEKPQAKVTKIDSKRRTKWRPQPMDTVTFEKLASSKLRINAKKAMEIAEKLYTRGIISYPRTETNKFPPDIKLRDYVQNQVASPIWGQFAARVLQDGPNPRNGKKTDQAHPPIHPLKFAGELTGDEQRIYELVVRHFLACLSKDAVGNQTTVDIVVNQELFYLTGLIILERNYLDVYPYDVWSDKEIPEFGANETFTPDSIMMTDGKTTAPQLLTEAELIALMDKNGIGTDATAADHIDRIKHRGYIQETSDRRLAPTELGVGLVDGYDEIGYDMSKPHLRATLEQDLVAISEGTKNPKDVLRMQLQQYERVFKESVRQVGKLSSSLQKQLTNKLVLPNPSTNSFLARGNFAKQNKTNTSRKRTTKPTVRKKKAS